MRHPPFKNLDNYVGGESDEADRREIDEHLNSCARCRKTVESLERLNRLLPKALDAHDMRIETSCLPPVMLADYLDGLLSSEQRVAAEHHLAACRACRENLIEIQRALEEGKDPGSAGPGDELVSKTLELIRTARATCPACGAENPSGAPKCTACGALLGSAPPGLLCISCRQPIPAASRFCPVCGAAIAPPKRTLRFLLARRGNFRDLVRTHTWLVMGLASICVSFFTRRHFLQFIALGVIFGGKWVLDQAQFRIYGEILKSLKKETESEREPKRRAGRGR